MEKYIDNDFGKLIQNTRKNKRINAEALVRGICSVKVLYSIEAGDVFPDYMLRNILIGRLGLALEWFEKMLTYEEYEEWKFRDELMDALVRNEHDRVDVMLEEYRTKYLSHEPDDMLNIEIESESENLIEIHDRLRMQFYLTMRGMSHKSEADYKLAAAMTSDICGSDGADERKLAKYKLSINELNLYAESAWLSGDKRESEKDISIIIQYLDKKYYDNKEKIKLLSKLAVYYCRLNENTEDTSTLNRMWKLCEKAVDMLRVDKKSYYIIELFDIQLWLADKLSIAVNGDGQKKLPYDINAEKNRIRTWRDVMANEYRKREVPLMMSNDSYIYREGKAYCINDVIRARRLLLGLNRKNLSEGICAEKTIEKTEQHRSNLHYANMKQIFDKLNLPCVYQNSSIIAETIDALEDEEKMWAYIGGGEPLEGLAILEKLRDSIPDYAYNRQVLGRAEIMIMKRLGKITIEGALKRMIDLVELTVPMEYIHRFVMNKNRGLMKNERVNRRIYFTSAEIYCLISVGKYYGELRDYENADFYFRLLYEYFVYSEKEDVTHGEEDIYRVLAVIYSSLLGNLGKYEMSNRIADTSAKRQMELNRPQKVWWHKYNNLWNDSLKEKDKDMYNAILTECATLCRIYDTESAARTFSKKITE